MICKNCGNEFEGRFCNQCGQKEIRNRPEIKNIVHDFIHAVTHLDAGILFLIKELFFRPGIVAKEYIEGKRKKYYNPFQFLLISVAGATFLSVNFHLFGPQVDPDTLGNLTAQVRWGLLFNSFIYKYFNVIILFSVPVTSLYSKLVFRRSGYNYAEHLIFNSFIAGEGTVIYIALTPLMLLYGSLWYNLVWIIYFAIAFRQFFPGNKFLVTLKFLLVLILTTITSQGLSMGIFTLFFYK